jgi:hypothetical protein
MMARMGEFRARIMALTDQMNMSAGEAKTAAMAALLNALVEQHKAMRQDDGDGSRRAAPESRTRGLEADVHGEVSGTGDGVSSRRPRPRTTTLRTSQQRRGKFRAAPSFGQKPTGILHIRYGIRFAQR